jgi:2'-5' RNA ligase
LDHLIALLDADHERVVGELSRELADALSMDVAGAAQGPPHITVVSYTGLAPDAAARCLTPVLRRTAPVTVRAHGYGMFTGDAASDLSLHVMVVRTRELDELHRRAHAALVAAGACAAGTTAPAVWTPHITLLDRGLTPDLLARAVALLASRPRRRWNIELTTLTVASRAASGATPGATGAVTAGAGPASRALSLG